MSQTAPTPPTKAASKSEQKRVDAQKRNGAGETDQKEKKPRAPRQDYGFAKDAVIRLNDGDKTYKGKRLEMYQRLKESNGKTVEHFLKTNEDDKDPPRGWLRFFVQNEACRLEGGTKTASKEPTKENSTAPK